MKGKQFSCSFTGHRPTKLPWGYRENDPRCIALKERIFDAVEAAYAEGYTHFLCGMAQGCDMYFGEAVLALKERCSDVTLEAVIPCPEQTKNWPVSACARYERILEAAIMNALVRDKVPVTVTLINGTEFQGVVARYDVLVVVLAAENKQQIIYKHSIASITPQSILKSVQPKL